MKKELLARIRAKKEYGIILLCLLLFATVSILAFTSIYRLQGTARVVNYVGIVRGATQKLVKRELMGHTDDPLIARLDSIIAELISGTGPNDLIVLKDEQYLKNMEQVRRQWEQLKEEIASERAGEPNDLFQMSEAYFTLVDQTVSSAEAFSEYQVGRSIRLLVGVNSVVLLLAIIGAIYFFRTAALKRRAEALGRLAYLDTMTGLPNRARAEQYMEQLTRDPPQAEITVLSFDMNNLKHVNDRKGHQSGDQMIAAFAGILAEGSEPYGFVARYGGDEFLAIFQDVTEADVERYLGAINEKTLAYNLLREEPLERISFAAGYVIGRLEDSTMAEMIAEADRRMYVRKRQMKESTE